LADREEADAGNDTGNNLHGAVGADEAHAHVGKGRRSERDEIDRLCSEARARA